MSKRIFVLLSTLTFVCLTSCNQTTGSTTSSNTTTGSTTASSTTSTTDASKDLWEGFAIGENAIEDAEQPSVSKPVGELSVLGQMRKKQDRLGLPQKGQANLLVVPVSFSTIDGKTANTHAFEDSDLDFLQNAYFASNDLYSVRSYYAASSYNKLELSGVIAPTFDTKLSIADFYKKANSEGAQKAQEEILKQVYDLYFTGDTATYDPRDFDSNKDGLIDGITLVYDYNAFNALTSQDETMISLFNNTTHFHKDLTYRDVRVGSYSWVALDDFRLADNSGNIAFINDNHNYLHEVGAMLGLPDYSDTTGDNNNKTRAPLGNLDMMDGKVFDHNPFSKYLLGWIDPKVITSDNLESVTLNSYEEDGSSLLLSNTKTDSPFGEYLLVEFYTPFGLNTRDSGFGVGKEDYPFSIQYQHITGGSLASFNNSGIKVYKVDSRLVKKSANGFFLNEDALDWEKNEYDFAFTNSSKNAYAEYGLIDNYPLVELLSSNGINRHMTDSSYVLNNEDYFLNGASFGSEDQIDGFYKNFTFDDGQKLGFGFNVSLSGTSSATIQFTKEN